jgi:hypothetical protein
VVTRVFSRISTSTSIVTGIRLTLLLTRLRRMITEKLQTRREYRLNPLSQLTYLRRILILTHTCDYPSLPALRVAYLDSGY